MHLEKQMEVLTLHVVKRELLQEERLAHYEPRKASSKAVYNATMAKTVNTKLCILKRAVNQKKAYGKKESVPTEDGATISGESGERRPRFVFTAVTSLATTPEVVFTIRPRERRKAQKKEGESQSKEGK